MGGHLVTAPLDKPGRRRRSRADLRDLAALAAAVSTGARSHAADAIIADDCAADPEAIAYWSTACPTPTPTN